MGAGTKILAGCGCLALVAAIALAAGLGLSLFWLKDQARSLETFSSTTDEIDEWEAKANAHPYEAPPDGVIPEARLKAFLDVRRQVHEVYLVYKADLEELKERAEEGGDHPSPMELLTMGGTAARMFGDLRLAQVKALAGEGMSEKEYYAIQTAVYVAAGVAKAEEETGAVPAEAMSEAARQMREVMRAALEKAREEGVPGADGVSEADLEKLEERLDQMGASGSEALTVPPANVELFRKHEADIEKYAMHGLAFLGL